MQRKITRILAGVLASCVLAIAAQAEPWDEVLFVGSADGRWRRPAPELAGNYGGHDQGGRPPVTRPATAV
jgi:hypothetical protein